MTTEITTETLNHEIVTSLLKLRDCSSTFYDGPEGVYNEYSLICELIHHINNEPKITKEIWYDYFYFWEKYVKQDVQLRIENVENNDDIYFWKDYLDDFLDRMDLIYDLAEIIFK